MRDLPALVVKGDEHEEKAERGGIQGKRLTYRRIGEGQARA